MRAGVFRGVVVTDCRRHLGLGSWLSAPLNARPAASPPADPPCLHRTLSIAWPFDVAEETLLREIENRYPAPDAVSPRHIGASPASTSSGAGAAVASSGSITAATPAARRRQSTSSGAAPVSGGAEPSGDTVDFQPALAAAQTLTPVDSMESAEK